MPKVVQEKYKVFRWQFNKKMLDVGRVFQSEVNRIKII